MKRIAPEACFLGFAAAFAYYYGMQRMRLPEWRHAQFDVVLTGAAPNPFQYRGLFAWIYRVIQESGAHLPFIETTKDYRFAVETLAAFCLLLSFRYYLSRCLSCSVARQVAVSLALVLPFHYLIPRPYCYYYVYDTPSVLFMTLGLVLLCERRWLLFYPLFAVATLNRETTCYLTLAYLLDAVGKERYQRIGVHVLAQTGVWMGIKLYLMYAFRDNAGGLFWNHLGWNLHALSRPRHLAYVLSSVGYLWIFVIPWWHRIGNRFVRRATLVAPVHFVAMLVVGTISEIRIFGEMIPIVLPAYLLVIAAALKRETAQESGAASDGSPP